MTRKDHDDRALDWLLPALVALGLALWLGPLVVALLRWQP